MNMSSMQKQHVSSRRQPQAIALARQGGDSFVPVGAFFVSGICTLLISLLLRGLL